MTKNQIAAAIPFNSNSKTEFIYDKIQKISSPITKQLTAYFVIPNSMYFDLRTKDKQEIFFEDSYYIIEELYFIKNEIGNYCRVKLELSNPNK